MAGLDNVQPHLIEQPALGQLQHRGGERRAGDHRSGSCGHSQATAPK